MRFQRRDSEDENGINVETSEIHPTNDHVNENTTYTDHKDDYEDICYLLSSTGERCGKDDSYPKQYIDLCGLYAENFDSMGNMGAFPGMGVHTGIFP